MSLSSQTCLLTALNIFQTSSIFFWISSLAEQKIGFGGKNKSTWTTVQGILPGPSKRPWKGSNFDRFTLFFWFKLDEFEYNSRFFKQDLKEFERGLANWQGMYEECKRQNESLSFKNRELENEKHKFSTDLEHMQQQMRRKDESLNKLRLANTKLKDTCLEQEKQLELYQSMYDGKVDEYKKALEESLSLIQDQDKIKNELRNVQETLRNEIKQKEELELRFECEKAHFDKQLQLQKERIHILENSLDSESDNSSEYVKEISSLQNDCFAKDMEIKRLESELCKLERELLVIKEEASRHITNISNLKSQHQSLTKMYDEITQKYAQTKNRICDLLEENDSKDSNFEYEKLRLQETINQQSKLIDYLQTLSEKPIKKVCTPVAIVSLNLF